MNVRRGWAAGAALGLMLTIDAGPAQARPHHDPGAIVYVSDRDSTSPDAVTDEIYLLDPQTRDVDRLSYDQPGVERWPTISPDGSSLAWVRVLVDDAGFPRPEATELYGCDLRFRAEAWTCRQPRRVTGPVFENAIAWTPDSRSILYSGPLNADGDSDIYIVNVRSGQTKNLTQDATVDGILIQNSQPTVAPNGRHFVYSRGGGPTGADLYRRNINGTGPEQLTAAPLNDIAADYSPDGRRLVFHSNRDGDGNSDIYTMRASVEGPDNPALNLTDELRSKDDVTRASQERSPSFSPDGRYIAFWWFTNPAGGYAAGFVDGEIYRMRVDGTRVRNLTNNNPTDPAALSVGDIQPDWGPRPLQGRRH